MTLDDISSKNEAPHFGRRMEKPRLLTFFLSFVLGLGPGLRSAEPESTSLRAYVEKHQRRQAYGVYLKNRKFGWAVDELKLGRHAGQDVALMIFEIQGSFNSGGEKARFEDRSVTGFDLAGKGEIIFGEERTIEDATETVRVAMRDGKAMVITTRSGGGETARRVPIPRETLSLIRDLELWLAKPPRKGAQFESYSTSWNEEKVDTRELFTYRGRKSILWGGVKTAVCLVDVNMDGALVSFEVLPDGTPLKGVIGGFFELRAEEEAVAKMPGTEPIDMLEASSIKLNKDLGDPEKLASLTLKITGLDNFAIPTSHRQRIQSRSGKSVVLELFPDRRVEKAAPLPARERAKYLESTSAIPSDHESLRSLAREIVRDEKDVLEKARGLQSWVYSNVRQSTSANSSSALDVLKNRAGDCTELTLLFLALARAAGIPAREVGGVMYADESPPLFGWHAWGEIHDGRQWISIDPTWNQVFVDAAHLKLAEDSTDWAWVNLLGKMKITVTKFSRKPEKSASGDPHFK